MADTSDAADTLAEAGAAAFAIGDVVHDRDDPDPSDAIVVNLPSKTAAEWIAYRETTVAEDNPDYPSDAATVVVTFADDLQASFPDWDGETHIPLDSINDSAASHYSFPAPRLAVVDARETEAASSQATATDDSDDSDSPTNDVPAAPASEDQSTDQDSDDRSSPAEPSGTEDDLSDPVRALKARLEDGGMSVEIEADGQTLHVSKLGDTYRIRPGEIVAGDGALRARLATIVEEFS